MTKTFVSLEIWAALTLRAAAVVGMNRGALKHVAIAVQKLKLISISSGLSGLLPDQQLGFGRRSVCKQKSFVQCYKPCSCVGCVQVRCFPNCTEEMGETRSSSHSSLAQGGCITGCLWGAESHPDVVIASRDESFSKALGEMCRTDVLCGQHLADAAQKSMLACNFSMAAQ